MPDALPSPLTPYAPECRTFPTKVSGVRKRPLGRGRHAVVYQAFDRRVGREVAIKRLVADTRDDAARGEARVLGARFFAEARTLARVRSPHVVALLDVQPTHRFIALSLCRGGNLRVAMRRRLLGPDDLPRVGAELQAALRAVHAAGAVHRDIKPANILVREAREGSPIALADFGLAELARGGRARGHAALPGPGAALGAAAGFRAHRSLGTGRAGGPGRGEPGERHLQRRGRAARAGARAGSPARPLRSRGQRLRRRGAGPRGAAGRLDPAPAGHAGGRPRGADAVASGCCGALRAAADPCQDAAACPCSSC